MVRQVIQVVRCDICGQDVTAAPQSERVGLGGRLWSLDLCQEHHELIVTTVHGWTERADEVANRPGPRRRRQPTNDDEWDYLTSLGFERHRGRKSAAEIEALRQRPRDEH
jgi:hypothetical protein